MDRDLNDVCVDNVVTNDSLDSLRKQIKELDQLQLAMVGGGIADIIGV